MIISLVCVTFITHPLPSLHTRPPTMPGQYAIIYSLLILIKFKIKFKDL